MRGILILTLWWICTCFGQAQTTIIPKSISIEDGLSQGFVSAIHQDREGFIWIGTKNGLNRYDGEKFEIYTHDSNDPYSIPSDWVLTIEEGGDYLIIGTQQGGLSLFHKKLKKFYPIPIPTGVATNSTIRYIAHLLLDDLNQLWVINGDSRKLIRLQFPDQFWQQSPNEAQLLDEIVITHFPDIELYDLKKDSNGKLYGHFHLKDRYIEIDSRTGKWHWVNAKTDMDEASPTPEVLTFLLDIPNQFKWYSPFDSSIVVTDFPMIELRYLSEARQLWLLTGKEILLFKDWSPGKNTLSRSEAAAIYPNANYRVPTVFMDRSGIIWLGTGGYGILKVNPRQLQIQTYFKDNTIYAPPLKNKKGEILVRTLEGNLFYHSNQNPRSFFRQPFLNGTWWLEGQRDTLWCFNEKAGVLEVYQLTPDGQFIYKDRLPTTEHYLVYAVAKDEKTKNIFWIVHSGGVLARYDTDNKKWQLFDFKHLLDGGYECYTLVKTANEHWWIGTSKGLVHGIPVGDTFEFELIGVEKRKLLNDKVASLLVDQQDKHLLWMGTKGGGLHLLDTRTGKFTYWTEDTGLPNNVIYGVLQDEEGTVWMSSNKGIINLDPTSNTIRNFTKVDGMQSDEFNTWAYSKAPTGEFLFGGVSGLNVFHPKDLKANPALPNVWITGIRLNNEAITVGDSTGLLEEAVEYTESITLPFTQNNITLEFAALEYSAPLKNRFRYYLEGAEPAWTHEDFNNEATYLNLNPGKYTFKLKASNSDRVWNEEVTELQITILPPWYRSKLAYFIYVALFGLGIWQFLRFQKKRLDLRHNMELEQKEAARLKELDQAKSRLYTNITHEFRTPLTVISGMIGQLKDSNEIKVPIQRNAAQLLNLVNQMLDLRKLESGNMRLHFQQGDFIRYLRYLTESFHSFAEASGVGFHFLSKQERFVMDFDKEKIARIVSNLLSNAIKFTPEGGNVYIRTEIQDTRFLFEIQDTGRGIPQEELPHIFNRFYQVEDSSTRRGEGTGIGLTLVKELLTAMKGDIAVASTEGKGTTFSITLPITNDAPIDQDAYELQNLFIPQTTTAPEKTIQANLADSKKDQEQPTILLIEDNADVIHYLIQCLQGDYQLEIAMDGAEGIDKAIENTPDFIISDVMMPQKDGFEVCETLKTDERTSHIPIVLLTAKADIESRLAGLQHGADAYLAKPFHQKELLLHIQNFLALRQTLQAKYNKLKATDSSTAKEPNNLEDAFLQKIRSIIEKDLSNAEIGIPQIVRKIGMSRSQIYRKVKALTGKSPSIYIRSIRLAHAKQLLETTDLNVSEVGYEVGFSSPVYFSQVFFEEFGYRPNATRK